VSQRQPAWWRHRPRSKICSHTKLASEITIFAKQSMQSLPRGEGGARNEPLQRTDCIDGPEVQAYRATRLKLSLGAQRLSVPVFKGRKNSGLEYSVTGIPARRSSRIYRYPHGRMRRRPSISTAKAFSSEMMMSYLNPPRCRTARFQGFFNHGSREHEVHDLPRAQWRRYS